MIGASPPWPVRIGLVFALLLSTARLAWAVELSCAEAASAAEIGAGIPTGLLLAIGVVESGRIDATGKRAPWPWSVQSGGVGKYYPTPEAAIAAVKYLRAGGVQSIDIGCFQINLFHHPRAFPDLETGFEPRSNAFAAARFLVSLHDEYGAWEPAVAAYHSRADALGAPYRDMVLASWRGLPLPSGGPRMAAGFRIWGPAGEIGGTVQPLAAGAWIVMPRMMLTAR